MSQTPNQPSRLRLLSSKDMAVEVTGVGIHTGRQTRTRITHSTDSKTLQFKCKVGDVACSAPALWTRLSGTARSTALVLRGEQRKKVELRTIEHLMAAWAVSGFLPMTVWIDTMIGPVVDGDQIELPILDGSAQGWMALLQDLRAQMVSSDLNPRSSQVMRAWKIVRPFEVGDDTKKISFLPFKKVEPRTQLKVLVDFGGQTLKQSLDCVLDWSNDRERLETFNSKIAAARTFGFKSELEDLERRGLARGGTLKNAILLDGPNVVNPEGFRFENELAAHKAIDAIGDFALLGAPLFGALILERAGHSLHTRALIEAVRQGAIQEIFFNLDTGLELPLDSLR
jgi:UDP-3-O-[3-hydroxymyristoyl] N-acetylglucosamine deacetylase